MDYVLQGFGVFLGVLAGTAITLLVQWFNRRQNETQTLRNLKFELNLNIKKIERWLEEITEYRNAVNGDALYMYAGYFDLSRAVFITTWNMFSTGLLYKYLGHDDIGKLQAIMGEFSIYWEQLLNNQIAQNKANFEKAKAVQDVNFWENKFKTHKKALEDILTKLH